MFPTFQSGTSHSSKKIVSISSVSYITGVFLTKMDFGTVKVPAKMTVPVECLNFYGNGPKICKVSEDNPKVDYCIVNLKESEKYKKMLRDLK